MLLDVVDLTVEFPTDDGVVKAVRGVSFQLREGEVLGIVGESGSGKSVSSLAVLGLLPKTAQITGSVRLYGEELLGLSEQRYAQIRGNKISMIFQDPLTSLNPVYTVGYQISEAVLAHNDVSKRAAHGPGRRPAAASSASPSRSSGCTAIRTRCPAACGSGW